MQSPANRPVAEGKRKGISEIADLAVMKKLWKRIAKQLRKMRFQDFELAHDALEYLPLDWELDDWLADLCRELRGREYRASSPEIVRAAKGTGLTRPLAFLTPRDLVVYKTIVATAESALLRASKPWARFGRQDTNDKAEDGTPAVSGWFRAWLARQGQLWLITTQHPFLIETDIANFFPNVHVPGIVHHILSNSNLDEEVARLLEHMLQQFAPMSNYRPAPIAGLPQENLDCSRILAHTYLQPVDEAFEKEGREEAYSRWVDDIVVGADSRAGALRIVNRVQSGMEQLGLYPNSAKTRIITAESFTNDYMKEENDYLGELEQSLDAGTAVARKAVRYRLRRHIRSRPPRPKVWGQVLRRYYTIFRRMQDDALLPHAFRHLEDHADSVRNIYEYLATFPLTPERFERLRAALERLGGVYEDVDLLAHEYVCTAPNNDALAMRNQVAEWALDTVQKCFLRKPRLAAAACMTVGKFGTSCHLDTLAEQYCHKPRIESPARRQAMTVLVGANRLSLGDLAELTPQTSVETSRQIRFLVALITNESKAINMTLSAMEPIKRAEPLRWVVRPRMLFVAPVLQQADAKKWQQMAKKWYDLLKRNPRRYRDLAAERWLGLRASKKGVAP